MGKVRIKVLGLEELEKKQREEQKKRREEKKKKKAKIEGVGLKGGERTVKVEISKEELEKEKQTKEFLEKTKKEEEEKEIKRFVKIKHAPGKKYKKAKAEIEKALSGKKSVSLKKAIEILKKVSYASFDESVELHLNVSKTGLKGEIQMPHSIGKEVKVKIVDDKFIEDLEKGKVDFSQIDVLISHPTYMPRLSKFARILGPKKLFPNPKQGTLSETPEKAAEKFKSGILRWKTEPKFPLIHQMIGKLSFETEKLVENAIVFLRSVGKHNIKEAYIKSTMSPSIRLSLEEI